MANTKYIVKNFYKNIAQDVPPLLQYQFLVTITPGVGVRNGIEDGVDWDKLQLYCQGANVPRNQIGTADVNFFGKAFHMPTTTQPQHDWSTNIILTNNMNSYNELRRLVLKFSSIERNMGGIKTIPNLDIAIDILNQFSEVDDSQPRIILKGAYPTRIDAINLTYTDNARALTPGVQFKYQYSYFDMAHDRAATDSLEPGNVAPLGI